MELIRIGHELDIHRISIGKGLDWVLVLRKTSSCVAVARQGLFCLGNTVSRLAVAWQVPFFCQAPKMSYFVNLEPGILKNAYVLTSGVIFHIV